MASHLPPPPATDDAAKARRNRATFVIAGVALAIAFGGLSVYTSQLAQQHEQRVLSGDYPYVHHEAMKVKVKDSGEVVALGGVTLQYPRYVASMKFTPPGDYQAVIVAYEADPEKRRKAEMVIAAQDLAGHWHPASAPKILERLNTPTPVSPR